MAESPAPGKRFAAPIRIEPTVPASRKEPEDSRFYVALAEMLRNRHIAYALFLLLSGCGDWKMDSSELNARTAAPAMGPDCAGCHAYPLTDRNHKFHLAETEPDNKLNGPITCLDCHAKSIRFQVVTLFDSTYEDTLTGERAHTIVHPNPLDTNSEGRIIRNLAFIRVDTLIQHHPRPAPARAGDVPQFQEYLTSLAHLNDHVDVEFEARDSDTGRFQGQTASFNPKQESCSAVACHPVDTPYSFGSIAKGLPALPPVEPENP
jgi:hypothetical protein